MNFSIVDDIIKKAFDEDFPFGDITTDTLVAPDATLSAKLIAKEAGVIAGVEVFARVYALLGDVQCHFSCKDGDAVANGDCIAQVQGNAAQLLTGERTALNLLQRMSGIASMTRRYVEALSGSDTKLLDTRKTTPGMRYLEKYSVAAGGGHNHRFGLSDGILIKDNHIQAMGGIPQAVQAARKKHGFVRKIEVETENLDMVAQAIAEKADIIMLDNMDNDTMRKAVELIDGRALTECSGNVDLERLQTLGTIGVNYVSCGALTHSFRSLDISLRVG